MFALAALAATGAFAQSSISITGLVDLGINQTNFKGNTVLTTGAANGSATSNFTIAGTEDMGAGTTAEFRWEMDPDLANTSSRTGGTPATGTTSNVTSFLGNGASWVGATNATLGSIKFGTPNIQTLSANGEGNGGFATAIGSGYRVSSFDAVRFQNSMRYDTPVMAGFAVSLVYSAQNDKQRNVASTGLTGNFQNQTSGRDGAQEIGLTYAGGPLSVRYANLVIKQYASLVTSSTVATTGVYDGATLLTPANLGAQFKLDTLSAKYSNALPGLNLSYFYQKATSDTLSAATATGTLGTQKFDRTTNGIAASYAITPVLTAMVNYQEVKNGSAAASTTGSKANLNAKVTGLGLDYALSKRTTVYARYENDADSAASFRSIAGTGYTAATGNVTYTAAAVGLRHTF